MSITSRCSAAAVCAFIGVPSFRGNFLPGSFGKSLTRRLVYTCFLGPLQGKIPLPYPSNGVLLLVFGVPLGLSGHLTTGDASSTTATPRNRPVLYFAKATYCQRPAF